MRAVVVEYGASQQDAIDRCVALQSQSPPTIDQVPDGAIVVAVKAAEIVWTDTVMATGQYQHQARLPYSPGMTYAGVVAFASPKALKQGVKVGDRVAIAGVCSSDHMSYYLVGIDAGPRSSGVYQTYGGCASYAIAPVSAIRQFPPNWSFLEASCFAYGYDTAYHALVECGKVFTVW